MLSKEKKSEKVKNSTTCYWSSRMQSLKLLRKSRAHLPNWDLGLARCILLHYLSLQLRLMLYVRSKGS